MRKTRFMLLLVVIAAAFAATYYFYFRPDVVARRAVSKLSDVKTAAFTSQLTLNNDTATQNLIGEPGTVEINLDGVFDRGQNPSSVNTNFDVNIKSESVSVQIAGQLELIGDQLYFIINKTPSIFPSLVAIKGQWLSIPRGNATTPPANSATGDLFTQVKPDGSEKISGTSTARYQTIATTDAVIQMMDGIANTLGTQLTDAQINSIRDSVTSAGNIPVELWITPWSNDLKQISATLNVPGGNTTQFTLTFKNTNQLVSINPPESATPLNQLASPSPAPDQPTPEPSPSPSPTP
ncbi:MAG: hypothetical protein Q8P73_05120 [bacterium]|nr:hypothetical protein [bacterium]